MDLEQAFRNFIQENRLVAPADQVLVAVSGGVDSVVLAHLFRQSNQKFSMAHCNFGLRGTESDDDEQFVFDLAKQWNVHVFTDCFNTKKYAAENGLSVQMAARELRYRWFEGIRKSAGFAVVATGHNLNDSIETSLLHFIRGTGLTGLGGIPVRNGHVVRPLLFATREAILRYAQTHALQWREDSSNAQTAYTRNAIRMHVLPPLLAINPAFLSAASNTMRHVREADANLQFFFREMLGEPDADGIYHLSKSRLAVLPALQGALFDLLQPFGFTADQAQQIVHCWRQTGAEWHSPSGYRLFMERDDLLLTNKDQLTATVTIAHDDLMVRTPDGGSLVLIHAVPDTAIPDDRNTVLLDADKVHFPLHLRRWQPGDVFHPQGMAGKRQKLQDFFTNQKLSRLEKEQSWILTDAKSQIVWIVGMRPDERFIVGDSTSAFLKINWVK